MSPQTDLDKCLDLARAWLKQNQAPFELNLTYNLDGSKKVDMPVGSEIQCVPLPQKDVTNPLKDNVFPDPEKSMTQAFINTAIPKILEIAVTELGYTRKNSSRVKVSDITIPEIGFSGLCAQGHYQFIPPAPKKK